MMIVIHDSSREVKVQKQIVPLRYSIMYLLQGSYIFDLRATLETFHGFHLSR